MSSTKNKRFTVGAFAATALLAATLGAPAVAFGADGDVTVAAAGETKATITGTIKATTLNVTVPTKAAFTIDPGATQDATKPAANTTKSGQFTSSKDFTITNNSAVDVYGYVSKVTSEGVTLVSDKAQLAKPGGVAPGAANKAKIKMMVGIADTATDLNLATAGDWMVENQGAAKYYAFNKATHGKLDASTNAPTVKGGSATMTMRGAVHQGGWTEGESFTVNPVFMVQVTDPSK